MKKPLLAVLAALFATADLVADIKFTYTVRTDGNVAITAFAKSTKNAVTVPSEVDGKKVVALQGAFNGCTKVTSVTIPATVKEIGDNTFKNTSKLKTLKFANGSAGVSIGNDAFSGSKLKELTIPANSKVDDFAFYNSKIVTLEVCDTDPTTNLANIDDFLSPYNSAGTKLMSEIKTLIVPTGCTGAYKPYLYQFLSGRKKKNRGTVRAQYPRVYAEKTTVGGIYQGTGYFKVGGKKVADGTPVKPGTKVQFVATAATGFAPQYLKSKVGSGTFAYVGGVKTIMSSETFAMPSNDKTYLVEFTAFANEKNGIDSAASTIQGKSPILAYKGSYFESEIFFDNNVLKTKTGVSGKGLPKGVKIERRADNRYYLAGTPTTTFNIDYAPAFVALTGAGGYSRIVRLPLKFDSVPVPSSSLNFNSIGISQNDSYHVVRVLAGLSYPKDKHPVQISASKKISVKASGLPAGIKLVKLSNTTYTFAGRPTKPGVYMATATVTIGGKKETHQFAYEVHKNPLAGSYRGYVSSYALGCGATTMSVAADGKATLSFTEGKTKTTVTGYPSFESGSTWDANAPLVGKFRFSFSVPKDSKRKLAKRTLKLAFLTDASSGVGGVARIRQGPISGFSLSKAETLRLYPIYSVAELKASSFYKSSSFKRDFGGFSVLIGTTDAQSDGEACWFATAYNYDTGKVALNGRLPAGKLVSTSVPFVASYHALDTWSFSESPNYKAIETAPLVVTDTDGVVYVIKLPTDPSEFRENTGSGHESVGVFSWNRFGGSGLFERLPGTYKYNARKTYPSSARSIVSATPKLKFTFGSTLWSSATTLNTSVDALSIGVAGAGKIPYEFDPQTGLWAFDFEQGGFIYTFEGIPPSTPAATFHGMIGRSADGKNWVWGAAKVE